MGDADIETLLARPPAVARYAGEGRRAPGTTRLHAGRVWAAASALLAAAGIAAVVVLPQDTGSPARLDVPLAADAAPVVPTPVPAPAPAAPIVPAAASHLLPASDPVRVQIPALGVTSKIMQLGLKRDGSMEVPPGAYPVGWYDGSATPGQLGSAVLAAHVDWKGEPGAFYGLRKLRAGDTILVDRADGTVVTFRVDRVEEHPKDDFPADDVYGDMDGANLRLITCGGAFDEDTKTYQANIVVFASLTASA